MSRTILKKRRNFIPRPVALGVAFGLALPGCAVDKNTGAQSFAGIKVSDDPCASTAATVGAVLGGVIGGIAANQVNHRTDTKLIGIAAGAGVGALIGREVDRRRCELFKIAKKHSVAMTVTSLDLPEGPLTTPGGAAHTENRNIALSQGGPTQAAGSRPSAAGLSVTLRDGGNQFEPGSDQLVPQAKGYFSEIAEQYSLAKQSTKLQPNASRNERDAIEGLRNKRIFLIGHTDDTGSSRGNADLSERRAMAVAKLFKEQGIPDGQLFYQGAGETLPIADNHTDDGRAQNRRVEIVDVTDDATFQKYLATRTQRVDYYRVATSSPGPSVPPSQSSPPAVARAPSQGPNKSTVPAERVASDQKRSPAAPQTSTAAVAAPTATAPASPGALDFGGAPASKVTAAADFGKEIAPKSGFSLVSTAYASGGPVVPSCSADRPRVSNGVKSLRDRKDISVTEYMPGLYNTSWVDTVNGNLVGLSNVAVYRDGGSPANRPNLYIYKGYKSGSGSKADYSAQPEVNAYRGDKAILYRVFVNGPLKCMDIVFPYDNSGEAKNSNLFYEKQNNMYVAGFKPRLVR